MASADAQTFEESMREGFEAIGLSESAARVAARGRDVDTEPSDLFDTMCATFRTAGLSEAAARAGAIGRDGSERAAREAGGTDDDHRAALTEATTAAARLHGVDEARAKAWVHRQCGPAAGAGELRAYARIIERDPSAQAVIARRNRKV